MCTYDLHRWNVAARWLHFYWLKLTIKYRRLGAYHKCQAKGLWYCKLTPCPLLVHWVSLHFTIHSWSIKKGKSNIGVLYCIHYLIYRYRNHAFTVGKTRLSPFIVASYRIPVKPAQVKQLAKILSRNNYHGKTL